MRQNTLTKRGAVALRHDNGSWLGWLFRWSNRDQHYADNNKEHHAQQLSAWDQVNRCLHRHQRGMSKARPCRERDEAAMLTWVADC
jgi:hypothetical protein